VPVSTSAKPPAARWSGYFTNWGIYDRAYQVKNLETTHRGQLT